METDLANGEHQVEEDGTDPEPEVADAATRVATSEDEAGSDSPSDLSVDQVDRLLDEVEGALSRLDDGTYGTCAACGGTIEDALLAASPTARTCAACTSPSVASGPDPSGSDS
jgi:RNA polymerase-binding transcription factor DksA